MKSEKVAAPKESLLQSKETNKLQESQADFKKSGLLATGINTKNNLVEIVEIPTHPWFVGVQFHPEYKSTVANPHPLFIGFINACIQNKKQTDETK